MSHSAVAVSGGQQHHHHPYHGPSEGTKYLDAAVAPMPPPPFDDADARSNRSGSSCSGRVSFHQQEEEAAAAHRGSAGGRSAETPQGGAYRPPSSSAGAGLRPPSSQARPLQQGQQPFRPEFDRPQPGYRPYQGPSLAQFAYDRTARGLSEKNPHAPDRRWNPILGGYVRSATAEQDIAQEVYEHDMHNFQHGMAKVMKREGEYDPIFWRHRVTKEEAQVFYPRRGPRQVITAPKDCLGDTLRMSEHQEALATQRRQEQQHQQQQAQLPQYQQQVPFYRNKYADQVRALFDPSDPLATPIHGDTFKPVPNRQTCRQVDHVGMLIKEQWQDAGAEFPDDKQRPSRKGYAAFHFTVRSPGEYCVANLISEEKSKGVPLPPPPPVRRTVYSDRMRSGEALRLVMHPDFTDKALGRNPYYCTNYLPKDVPVASRHPDHEGGHPYRRPQFIDQQQYLHHHQQHAHHESRPSTPSSAASSVAPGPILRDALPPSSSSSAAAAAAFHAHRPSHALSGQGGGQHELLQESAFVAGPGPASYDGDGVYEDDGCSRAGSGSASAAGSYMG